MIVVKKYLRAPQGGEYAVGILYENNGRQLLILSHEKPQVSLPTAVARVVMAACEYLNEYLKLPALPKYPSLTDITFGDDGTVLHVAMQTPHGEVKITLPKIPSQDVVKVHFEGATRVEEYDFDAPRNLFNQEVHNLRLELSHYIQGQREQMSLEFEEEAKEQEDKNANVIDFEKGRAPAAIAVGL